MFDIYTPGFFDCQYTADIQRNLYSLRRIRNDSNHYYFLSRLQSHAFKFRNGIIELQQILQAHFLSAELINNLRELENAVGEAIKLILDDKLLPIELKNTIDNRITILNNEVENNNVFLKTMSTANMLMNSATLLLAGTGILIGASMCVSGPILPALLGLAYMMISASVAACALYTTVAEGRFLANQQIKEISEMGSLLTENFAADVPDEIYSFNPNV